MTRSGSGEMRQTSTAGSVHFHVLSSMSANSVETDISRYMSRRRYRFGEYISLKIDEWSVAHARDSFTASREEIEFTYTLCAFRFKAQDRGGWRCVRRCTVWIAPVEEGDAGLYGCIDFASSLISLPGFCRFHHTPSGRICNTDTSTAYYRLG